MEARFEERGVDSGEVHRVLSEAAKGREVCEGFGERVDSDWRSELKVHPVTGFCLNPYGMTRF